MMLRTLSLSLLCLLLTAPAQAAQLAAAQKAPAKKAPPRRIVRVIEQDPEDPIVYIRVLFQTGSRDDPAGKEGLTALTAELMGTATTALSATELERRLFPWAAGIEVQVDKETVVFSGRVHRDNVWPYLSVFAQVLQSPRFDPDDFRRKQNEAVSYLTKTLRSESDELLAREVLETELYDRPLVDPARQPHGPGQAGIGTQLQVRHPYRHHPAGTEQGLAAITLDDVKAHHAHVFTRDRVMLGLTGGATAAHAEFLLAALGALPASSHPRATLPPPPAIVENTMLLVEQKTAGTPLSIGYHLAITRSHPDYPALKLAEAYFGEHRSRVGHLFNAMREQRGLNYGDYAYVEHFVQDGWTTNELLNIGRQQQYFSIWIRPVEHKNRNFALHQALYELDRFVARGIPDDESFKSVQAFLSGYQRAKEQDPDRRLGYLLDDIYHRAPLTRDELKARMQTLTRAEVNAAIRRHLRADRLRIVAVTADAAAFAQALKAHQAATITYPAPPGAAILDEDKAIGAYDIKLKAGNIRVVRPDQLFVK